MAKDGSLIFDTAIDTKGFEKGTNSIGSIAKKGFSVAGAAIAGVTASLGAAVVAGVKYNATMEDYFANFQVMLGSAEEATKFVNQLKEMSAKTPFEMSDLADASKTLLAFGSSSKEATKQLQMLGDISLGNAQKLGTLAVAFGRIQSNGKASMEEINMMIE